MRSVTGLFIALVGISAPATALAQAPQQRASAASGMAAGAEESQRALQDIERTFGFVPQFMRTMPSEALPGAWEELKAIGLNRQSAIPGRYKELIGLAVASQIPCRYCIYAHTQGSRQEGASDREIREALAISAVTQHWQTMADGLQLDDDTFRTEVGRIIGALRSPLPANGNGTGAGDMAAVPVTDAPSAYRDMTRMFGFVPTLFRGFPEAGIAGAWKELKALEFTPNTALPPRYKDLIGLSVSAQMGCKGCVHFYTEAAKTRGATEAEVREALAMGALTRHWSTMLNGSSTDEATFRREYDRMLQAGRKQRP